MDHIHAMGKQRVHEVDAVDHARVVAYDGDVLVHERGQISLSLSVAQTHVLPDKRGGLLATCRQGCGEEQGSSPHQAEFVHQLEDAFGDGGIRFGGSDLMQCVSPLARQQGV